MDFMTFFFQKDLFCYIKKSSNNFVNFRWMLEILKNIPLDRVGKLLYEIGTI